MRYWALFTVRMMATAGLFLVLLVWCLPHSELWSAGANDGHMSVRVWAHGWGWQLMFYSHSPGPSSWWVRRHDEIDFDAEQFAMKRSSYLNSSTKVMPGLYYRSGRPLRFTLDIDHWLLCLTFFIATIATSVRWRKRPAEQERADE